MSLRLGGRARGGWWQAAIQRRRARSSQVGGHGPDLRVRVVVRAVPLACTTTHGPDEPQSSPHPEAGRHGGAAGGPSLRDPGLPDR